MPEDGQDILITRIQADVSNLEKQHRSCEIHYHNEVKRVDADLDEIRADIKAINKDVEDISAIMTNNRVSITLSQWLGGFILLGVLGFNTVQLLNIRDDQRSQNERVGLIEQKQSGAISERREQIRQLQDQTREHGERLKLLERR